MYWKKIMITASDISIPYSRRFFLMIVEYTVFSAVGCPACTASTLVFISVLPRFNDLAHDFFLAGFRCGHFGDECPFVHYVNTITHSQQLWHFRRNKDDAFSFLGELGDEGVDLILRAHIDAPRGLVKNQDIRPGK